MWLNKGLVMRSRYGEDLTTLSCEDCRTAQLCSNKAVRRTVVQGISCKPSIFIEV